MFVGLCICIFFVGVFSFATKAHAGADPVQSIKDVQTALDTADEALFNKVVDMESLVGQCIDIFMEDADKADQSTLPKMLALMLSTVKKSETARVKLRSTLVAEASEFVRYGVRSGAFGGLEQNSKAPTKGLLATFFAQTSMARKEIVHIAEPVEESGAVYVFLLLKDHDTKVEYPVEAWLREEAGEWRVVGLRNVRTLMRILQGENTLQNT